MPIKTAAAFRSSIRLILAAVLTLNPLASAHASNNARSKTVDSLFSSEAFANRAIWSLEAYGHIDAPIKSDVGMATYFRSPATPFDPDLSLRINTLRHERARKLATGNPDDLMRALAIEKKLRFLIAAEMPWVDVGVFIAPVIAGFSQRARIYSRDDYDVQQVEAETAIIVAAALQTFLNSHKKVLSLPRFKWRNATENDRKTFTDLFTFVVETIEVPYNLIGYWPSERTIQATETAAAYLAFSIFQAYNWMSLFANGKVVPATPYRLPVAPWLNVAA